MLLPYASTLISVVKAALKLVESSGHLPESSPALHQMREAVRAVTAELAPVARNETHHDPIHAAAEDFYQRPD